MRVLAITVAALVGAGMLVGAGVLFAIVLPEGEAQSFVLPAAASPLLIGPLLAFSYLTFWDLRSTPAGRTIFRRLLWAVVAMQVAGIGALVVFVGVIRAAWWLPLPMAALAAVFTAGAFVLGPTIQRREARSPRLRPATPSPYSREDLQKDVRRIVVAGAITLVASAAVMTGVLLALDVQLSWTFVAIMPLALALFASSIASNLVVNRLGKGMRELVSGDLTRLRRISKTVLGKKGGTLAPEDEAVGATYAATAWILLSYSLGGFAGLLIGLGLVQAAPFTYGSGGLFHALFIAFVFVSLAVLTPIQIGQIRRARRYARESVGVSPGSDPAFGR